MRGRRRRRWSGRRGRARSVRLKDPCSSDYSFSDLTLAGSTALWWDFSTGNHVYCDDVFTALLPAPKGTWLGVCDGSEGDTYYEFAGDSIDRGDRRLLGLRGGLHGRKRQAASRRRLRRRGAARGRRQVKAVLPAVDFRSFLDAGNWRVAIDRAEERAHGLRRERQADLEGRRCRERHGRLDRRRARSSCSAAGRSTSTRRRVRDRPGRCRAERASRTSSVVSSSMPSDRRFTCCGSPTGAIAGSSPSRASRVHSRRPVSSTPSARR